MSLREQIGHYFLRKGYKPNTTKRRAVNFHDVKSLAIVCSAKDEEHARSKIQYAQVIRKNWAIPKVNILCLVDVRKEQDWFFQYSDVEFVTSSDLNWYYKPKALPLKDSVDLLICLDLEPTISSMFTAVLIKAKMKMSSWSEIADPYFDFFIRLNQNSSLNEFIQQTEHYLKLINNKAKTHETI